MAARRTRLTIRGRVQGVFFRHSALKTAEALGLQGWVRNRLDGSVEVLFQGAAEQVQLAVTWCQHGPPTAQVIDVAEHEEPVGPLPPSFGILGSD